MSTAVEAISEWVVSLRDDVEIVKAVLEREAVPVEARRLAAGALGYLLSRMDLIPDWNPTIGIVDDVLVLRVCMDLAAQHHPSEVLDDDVRIGLGRLANHVDLIREFLGAPLFESLRRYCRRLPDVSVHGRSPALVLADQGARQALYNDIEADLAHLPEASFHDPDEIALRLRSYLHYKLEQS